MRILFVASDPMEFTGILAKATQVQPESSKVDWSRSANLGGNDVLLAANGVGWKRAAAAVDAAQSFRPHAIVSTGFCGALEDGLAVGDVVVGDVVAGTGANRISCRPVTSPAPYRTGAVCSLDHVAQTSEEKRLLRSSGACVVEMEAAGVGERAQSLGLAFHCVKVVTDLAGETMVNDFNSALRSDGHFDTMLILRRSLRHPTARLPELLRLRKRCNRAARVLGEFFADCRF
ncbi:MAG TPA: hypothetical protein VKU19_10185 [Bryobacteraceae bacterium]|nr:hypothetical protein [Bryobacteraceae bacterium]